MDKGQSRSARSAGGKPGGGHGRWAVVGLTIAIGACSSGDRPDESGLTHGEKNALVERYYACARDGDAQCVRTTLHPSFAATDSGTTPVARAAHAALLVGQLSDARVEARLLPHEGAEVWVVELWIDKHGSVSNRLRAFAFDQRLIRAKTALAG